MLSPRPCFFSFYWSVNNVIGIASATMTVVLILILILVPTLTVAAAASPTTSPVATTQVPSCYDDDFTQFRLTILLRQMLLLLPVPNQSAVPPTRFCLMMMRLLLLLRRLLLLSTIPRLRSSAYNLNIGGTHAGTDTDMFRVHHFIYIFGNIFNFILQIIILTQIV